MKKYLLLFLVLAIMSSTAATAQIAFGVEAGPSISNQVTKEGPAKSSSQLVLGGIGGVYAMIPFSGNLFLKPALLYQTKGGSVQVGDGNKIKSYLHYISLPVELLLKSPMQSGNGSWLTGVGPYFAYGVSGKQTRTFDNSSFDLFEQGGMKRPDAGINAALGFELTSGLHFILSADIGLLNLASHGNQDNYSRNKSFNLMIGYTFSRN